MKTEIIDKNKAYCGNLFPYIITGILVFIEIVFLNVVFMILPHFAIIDRIIIIIIIIQISLGAIKECFKFYSSIPKYIKLNWHRNKF